MNDTAGSGEEEEEEEEEVYDLAGASVDWASLDTEDSGLPGLEGPNYWANFDVADFDLGLEESSAIESGQDADNNPRQGLTEGPTEDHNGQGGFTAAEFDYLMECPVSVFLDHASGLPLPDLSPHQENNEVPYDAFVAAFESSNFGTLETNPEPQVASIGSAEARARARSANVEYNPDERCSKPNIQGASRLPKNPGFVMWLWGTGPCVDSPMLGKRQIVERYNIGPNHLLQMDKNAHEQYYGRGRLMQQRWEETKWVKAQRSSRKLAQGGAGRGTGKKNHTEASATASSAPAVNAPDANVPAFAAAIDPAASAPPATEAPPTMGAFDDLVFGNPMDPGSPVDAPDASAHGQASPEAPLAAGPWDDLDLDDLIHPDLLADSPDWSAHGQAPSRGGSPPKRARETEDDDEGNDGRPAKRRRQSPSGN